METESKNIAYSADSHCYTFRMPEEDIVVDAVYKKVAAKSRCTAGCLSFYCDTDQNR